jgi:D-hexose-6-phosphate mutarotase
MATLLNKLFIDSFSYFSKKELSISNALKITDILLLQLSVSSENEIEFNSYMNDFIELNSLLSTYFNFLTDIEEIKLFENKNYELLKTLNLDKKKKGLVNLKSKRLSVYQKYEPELITLVQQFKSEINLKVA